LAPCACVRVCEASARRVPGGGRTPDTAAPARTHLDPLHVGGAPDDDVVVLVARGQELVQVGPRELVGVLRAAVEVEERVVNVQHQALLACVVRGAWCEVRVACCVATGACATAWRQMKVGVLQGAPRPQTQMHRHMLACARTHRHKHTQATQHTWPRRVEHLHVHAADASLQLLLHLWPVLNLQRRLVLSTNVKVIL
jgi:hypothetical protein